MIPAGGHKLPLSHQLFIDPPPYPSPRRGRETLVSGQRRHVPKGEDMPASMA
jgi:hypothetical protein